ncbi:DUF6496 domain-containing protein [Chitinophaga vietnamensis]|uniref:DUF6496 domain-containing protein n=1 Tax=Chitinophaga vietnamensis TaxID=2593957 RepID=UPI001F4099DA|nr:DUF6496 domain-containing protein [Chitinophaga vietnamensis]
MAKYPKKAQQKVEKVMHEMHEGKLKSGRSHKKVKDPKQAIAIGLSEARKAGADVPKKKAAASSKTTTKKTTAKRATAKKATAKKTTAKKTTATKTSVKKAGARKKATARKKPATRRAAAHA